MTPHVVRAVVVGVSVVVLMVLVALASIRREQAVGQRHAASAAILFD